MSKPVAVVSDLWGYILSVSYCKCQLIKNSGQFFCCGAQSCYYISWFVVDVSRCIEWLLCEDQTALYNYN